MKFRIKKYWVTPCLVFINAFCMMPISSCGYTQNSFLIDCTEHPEYVGFNPSQLDSITDYVNSRINTPISGTSSTCYGFPSMQICVVKDKNIIYNKAFGQSLKYNQGNPNATSWSQLQTEGLYGQLLPNEQQVPATTDTLYDLASNTKMYGAMLAIQNLLYIGKINSLDDCFSKYVPSFHKTQTNVDNPITGQTETVKWEDITIRQILSHKSGFMADPVNLVKTSSGSHPLRDKSLALEYILNYLDLEVVPETRQLYSDVDFMLAGILVKEVSGEYLDDYCLNHIYHPLGLHRTTFNPLLRGFKKQECAATELRGNTREFQVSDQSDIRTQLIQGEVHDEVSYYCMNGVSGNSGLFSTASDLSVLMNLMLYHGQLGGYEFFNDAIYNDVTTPIYNPQNHDKYEFCTGWKTNIDLSDNTYLFGTKAPKEVFGHDGWMGTFTLIDPINHLTICILTNACHTIMYDHDSNGRLFYGKQRYFVYDGQTQFNGTRISRVLFDLIYGAYQH